MCEENQKKLQRTPGVDRSERFDSKAMRAEPKSEGVTSLLKTSLTAHFIRVKFSILTTAATCLIWFCLSLQPYCAPFFSSLCWRSFSPSNVPDLFLPQVLCLGVHSDFHSLPSDLCTSSLSCHSNLIRRAAIGKAVLVTLRKPRFLPHYHCTSFLVISYLLIHIYCVYVRLHRRFLRGSILLSGPLLCPHQRNMLN